MKKLVYTPLALFCKVCGKYIDEREKFILRRAYSEVYCSRRCYYYDVLQTEKKNNLGFAHIDSILEKHCRNIEEKMNLLEAINETTSFIRKTCGVYWFFPQFYALFKWQVYSMFKRFKATPVDLDTLASDLYSIRYIGACG